MQELKDAGLDPLLIAPRWFHYSGLATAVLAGDLPPHANRIDVAALAKRRGLAFREGTAIAVAERTVLLHDGSRHDFDMLSVNTGSDIDSGIGGKGFKWPVKPLVRLDRLRAALTERMARRPAIAVAGAGATGTEIAAAIAGLYERSGEMARIHLIGEPEKGPGWRGVHGALEKRGVTLLPGSKVVERRRSSIVLDDGTAMPCDYLVAATGLVPNPLGRRVAATLQALGDPAVFASGDCAEFTPRPLPRHGVFGVRQAPVLAHNLAAFARGEPLRAFHPQQYWLSILDLGNGEGFATWGPFWSRSAAALRLKRRLDDAFMERLRG